MNNKEYEQIKEEVITFSSDKLFTYFEIIVDEINARKLNKEQNAD